LNLTPDDLDSAKAIACERLEQALDRVQDPVTLMQFFSQGKDTLEFSSRLIHRWPMDGHRIFRLEWASVYVAEKVATLLTRRLHPNAEETHRGSKRKLQRNHV
jgi:hypothetical protein